MKPLTGPEASQKAESFSLNLLRAAFEAVQNESDWRAPIDATIKVVNQELTREAVIWFTGCVPVITPVERYDASSGTYRSDVWVRVTAAGYRQGPCGP